MDVDRMTRKQLLAHTKKCGDCAADDPDMLTALRTSSLPDVRDYVASAHHPAWQAVTRKGRS